jgi:hypothetical protein
MSFVMTDLKINHSSIDALFLQHLSIPDNHRILFSAPFGQGKTTYLNEFFESNCKHYNTIKLFPVNYSVSSNEDVFELIKFDVLIQLVGKYSEFLALKKEDYSLMFSSQKFIRERLKLTSFLPPFLGLFGQIGKSVGKFIKVMKDTIDDFEAFNEELKIDERKDINAFLASVESKTGTAYEMDDVSALIAELIHRLTTDTKKESVLIIDDLDRLDPDHIFRLFNVFSAHLEEVELSSRHNKFGFDKVIFVCDIENIRRIYRHKYGAQVDFKGYLDKFYSYMPFEFDNRKNLIEKLDEILRSMKFHENTTSSELFYNYISTASYPKDFKMVVIWLLRSLSNSGLLNLRTLMSLPTISIPNHTIKVVGLDYDYYIDTSDYKILWIFYYLKHLFPSWEIVDYVLYQLKSQYSESKRQEGRRILVDYENQTIEDLFSYCLPFLLPRHSGFPKDDFVRNEGIQIDTLKNLSCDAQFVYQPIQGRRNFKIIFKNSYNVGSGERVILNPYEVIYQAFVNCLKSGYLEK